MSGLCEHEEKRMEESVYVRRVMSPQECDEAFGLVDQEGWNMTRAKFTMLVKMFASNFFVTVKKETKEVVAVVSAIPTHPGQYFVGNLVVRPDFRLRGLGKAMLLHAMKSVPLSATFTLTAFPGTDGFYNKVGFQAIQPRYYVSHVTVDRLRVQSACSQHSPDDVTISEYVPSMFQALCDYDKNSRGHDSSLYLSVMTAVDISDSFLVATSKTRAGDVVGYAIGVDKKSHLLVEGLYADNDDITLQLYRTLLDAYPDKTEIQLEEMNPRRFLSRFGTPLPTSHSYTRMATGRTAPVLFLSKICVVCDCDFCE